MSKKRNDEIYEQRIIDALKRLPKVIYDKKHNLNIHIEDDQCRSNETRFEHIAKKYHELKVRDIEAIPKGINCYLKYSVSLELKETYYYYIRRKGEDKGFIQVAVKLYEGETTEAYVKTIFITHRIK